MSRLGIPSAILSEIAAVTGVGLYCCCWLCCRRAGWREGQIPSGHCRTGLHVHRTREFLRSALKAGRGFGVLVSCCCLRSSACQFLSYRHQRSPSTAVRPTAFTVDKNNGCCRLLDMSPSYLTLTTSATAMQPPPDMHPSSFRSP